MNFSEFAHMIYSYDTKVSKQSDFVIFLTNQIMEKPFAWDDEQKERKDEYNPLADLDLSTLDKIFNGSRKISKKHARIIRAHLNKDKFDEYITKFNYNAIDYFCETLKKAGISITDNEISRACADTFENILEDIIKDNPKDNPQNSTAVSVKKDVSPKDDRPFEEIFNDTIREFGVEGFLESDPIESLSPHFLDDMTAFVGIIQQSHKDKNTLHKDETTSCKMFEFSNTLLEYVKYLKEQMKPISTEKVNYDNYAQERYDMPEAYHVTYEPPKDNKDFEDCTLNYRNSLKSLYNEIQSLQQE